MKRLENLTWGEAVEYCLSGELIQRAGWNGQGMFVGFTEGKEIDPRELWGEAMKEHFLSTQSTVRIEPYFTLKTAEGNISMGYRPTPKDFLATDWRVIDAVSGDVLVDHTKSEILKGEPT